MTQKLTFSEYRNDIQELNLAYLSLAQQLLKTDFNAALFQLDIDTETGELLSQLSVSQVIRLSRSNTLISQFRMSDYSLLKQLSIDQMPSVLNNARTTIAMLNSHKQQENQLVEENLHP